MSDIFEALVAPVRRAILDELCERDGQTLFELCTRLAMKHQISVTRQGISQHLEILESAGLIETERQSRYKFHYIRAEPLKALAARWLVKADRRERDDQNRTHKHSRRRPAKGSQVLHREAGVSKEKRGSAR